MTIQTITARLHHPLASAPYDECYCFDAEQHGLIAEPFVPSATAAIAAACACLPPGRTTPPEQVTLRFTDAGIDALAPDPDSTTSVWVALDLIGPDGDGHNYLMHLLDPLDAEFHYAHAYEPLELWLCPVLLSYFPGGAPQRLFVQITPNAIPS